MATRRLLAILLVMLFLSSLVTALAPVDRTGETSSTSTTSTTTSSTESGETNGGVLFTKKIEASPERPPRVRAEVGDQLQLAITFARTETIEIPALGEAEDVDPDSPARFDLLLETADVYAVRFLGSDRTIALIEVSEPRSSSDQIRD